MNSMLDTLHPARHPIAMPSPVDVSGLVVYRYVFPAPPVARMTVGAWMATTRSLFESKTRSFDSSNILDNNVYNRFRARRVRLRLSGNQLFPGFSYRLQVDLAQSVEGDGELSGLLLDAWVGYNITKKLKILRF